MIVWQADWLRAAHVEDPLRRERERERDRQRETDRQRQRDRETERQRDRERKKERERKRERERERERKSESEEELRLKPRTHLVVERIHLGTVSSKVRTFDRFRTTLTNTETRCVPVPSRHMRMLGS